MRHHFSVRQVIHIIHHIQRLLHVVRHHQRRRAQRIVQFAHQVCNDTQRNRVQPGKRFVIHHDHRIQRNRPRQRHPPRHAARQFRRHQLVRAAQSDGMQLHHHQVADHAFRQAGVLAHLERHVVIHRQVGEQRAELEQHAHAPAHAVNALRIELAGAFTVDPHLTRRRFHHAAHQPQQRGLAGTTDAHQRDNLATRDRHVDARQYRTLCVRKIDVLDFDEGFGGHGCGGCCRKQRKRF